MTGIYSFFLHHVIWLIKVNEKDIELTKSEAVSRELPFVAIIGQAIKLLIKGHLVGIHDDGQVPCL